MSENKGTVFVTGATGFVAGHVIALLLRKGYKVVGSVRSLENKKRYEHLYDLVPEKAQNLSFAEGSLTEEKCWIQAIAGCDYVLHTASPLPHESPKNPDDVIVPAVKGAEFVLKAAIKNNVKKFVFTSSLAAVYTKKDSNTVFTEKDWSDPKEGSPYEASKHYAEKKAWEIFNDYKKNGGTMNFCVVLPSFVQGPSTSVNGCNSSDIMIKFMTKGIPGIANVMGGWVDVREVALTHINAMERDISNGQRYICCGHSVWMEDVLILLQQEFEQYGYKVVKSVMGDTTIRFGALFNNDAKLIKDMLSKVMMYDNSASIQDLGIVYRNVNETVVDTVYDLIEKGKLPNKLPKNHQITHRTGRFPEYYS